MYIYIYIYIYGCIFCFIADFRHCVDFAEIGLICLSKNLVFLFNILSVCFVYFNILTEIK